MFNQGSDGAERVGLGRRAAAAFAALLMIVVYGLSGTAGTAGAAGPLAAPTGLSPNGTTAGPNPTLSWNAVSGAKYYKVTYPNTQGTGTTTTTVYAPRFSPTVDLPSGAVAWSVTAYDQTNQPGASATANFTNAGSGTPSLTCPAAVVNYPVQSPSFSWTSIDGVKTYTLQVSSSSTFTPAATTTYQTQATSYTVTKGLPDEQTYYAQVSGTSSAGINTPTSAPCQFRVVWSSGTTGLNDATVALKSPTNSAHVRDVIMKWAPLKGAARYEVQVSPNGDWTNNLLYDIVTDSTVWSPAKALDNGSYFWRVRGIDNRDNKSRWSDYPSNTGDAWQFTVDPLATPVPLSPAVDATVANPAINFSWKPVPGAGAYMVQFADNAGFSYANQGDALNHTCLTTHTDWSPYVYENPPGQTAGPGGNSGCRANRPSQTGFLDGTTVYWRVRAVDDYTQNEVADPWTTGTFTTVNRPPNNRAFVSPWSAPRRFFINSTAPSALAPGNGTTVAVPTMTWSRVAGAEYYKVNVTTKPWGWNNGTSSCDAPTGNGSSRVYNTSALSLTPSLRAFPLDRTKLCPVDVTWSVQSVDWSDRLSPLPQASSFTWTPSTPSGATLGLTAPSPAANASTYEIPTFGWTPVQGADHYQVWWYDNPNGTVYTPLQDFNVGTNQRDPIAEGFTPVQPLPVGTGAWQVVALNASNQVIASSEKRRLTVLAPDAVALSSFTTRTQNGTAVTCTSGCTTPSTPLISWTLDPSATFYRVFVAQDANFTNIVRTYDTAQTSIRPVEALPDNQAGQSYYVFVQAVKGNWYTGTGSTSQVSGPGFSILDPSFVWSFAKQSSAITGTKTLAPTSSAAMPSTSACNDAAGVSTVSDVPTFCWNASSTLPYASGDLGAMSYHLQVSTTPDFSNIIDQAWTDQPSYTPYNWPQSASAGYSPGSVITPPSSQTIRDRTYPDGPLYWRVQAIDATSNGLTYSAVQTVTKASTPVQQSTPANNGSVGSTPSLSWQPKPLVAQYQIQVAKNGDTNFSSANTVFTQFTDLTAITPSANNNLTNGTSLPAGTYAWRVRGVDAGNNSGGWSTVRLFTVDPAAPSLTTPNDGVIFPELANMGFAWSNIDGAVKYRIYVSKNNPPTSGGFSVDTISNSWTLDRSLGNGKYYWQVQSLDAQNQVLASSGVRSFTLLGTRPTVTNLAATPGAHGTVSLTWKSTFDTGVGPITAFTVSLYSSASATTPSATRTVGYSTAPSYTWSGLSPNIRYWFTVTANDSYGPGPEANRVTAIASGYTASESFVMATYQDFLGRAPSSSELASGVAAVRSGTVAARKSWLHQFSTSPTWVNAIVTNFYFNTLGRAPDQGGLTYWRNNILSGKYTVAQVAASFYSSAEYFNGIGGGTLNSWVRDLYPKLLGRAPDTGGVNYWVGIAGRAQNAYGGRYSVAINFYQSDESRKKRVNDLYLKLLQRPADTGGLSYWAGVIKTKGDIALAEFLGSSSEYYDSASVRFP